jgi:hypothetical protein
LRCPADHPLYPQERRPERNGSLRVLYAARIGHCRTCPLREQCQENTTTLRPRRVSAVFWPASSHLPPRVVEAQPVPVEPTPAPVESTSVPAEPTTAQIPPLASPPPRPVLWGDWERSQVRRRWFRLLRTQTVILPPHSVKPADKEKAKPRPVQTRAERAHWRLSWEKRLARNAAALTDSPTVITLHGLPATFAHAFGFHIMTAA